MRHRKIVSLGKTKIQQGGSGYHSWLSTVHKNEDGQARECPQANPDVLAEGESLSYARGDNRLLAMKLMEEGIQLLTDRQKQVYEAYYYDYKTEHEIAEDMEIKQQSVSDLLKRAVANITKHCQTRAVELGMGDENQD